MDNLKSLMTSLDDISKLIPEGTYLEMCDNLKMVHDQIPRNNDPPVRDNRRLPFQVIQRGDNVESEPNHDIILEDPDWCVEMDQNEEIIRKLLADMKIADRSLRILKPIQRITKKVREDAIRRVWYWQNPTYVLDQWTFDNLVQNTDMTDWCDHERKLFMSKKWERKTYEDYKSAENQRIDERRNEVLELKRNLEDEISGYRDRQNYLRFTYYNL